MKRLILTLLSVTLTIAANAMSYEDARREALYLTDKMAYELNLNEQQYNDAYEINLDYFLSVNTADEIEGIYWRNRYEDLRCILHDWQWELYAACTYFYYPLSWVSGAWYFPIYSRYAVDLFYYPRPTVWYSYNGCHARIYHTHGYYHDRRPVWTTGLRSAHRGSIRTDRHIRSHRRDYYDDMYNVGRRPTRPSHDNVATHPSRPERPGNPTRPERPNGPTRPERPSTPTRTERPNSPTRTERPNSPIANTRPSRTITTTPRGGNFDNSSSRRSTTSSSTVRSYNGDRGGGTVRSGRR